MRIGELRWSMSGRCYTPVPLLASLAGSSSRSQSPRHPLSCQRSSCNHLHSSNTKPTTMPDFYYMALSSPCRSVMLTAKALGVDLNLKPLNLLAGEQMKPEFVAINPQHCVPTLVDGDLTLWESRAICSYLANQYGKDDSLYPKDPKVRAKVDRLMYFDMGTLYFRFGEYVYPVLFRGEEKANPEKLEKLQEALGWLNDYLAGHNFAVGDNITIADHVLMSTLSTVESAGIDIAKHENVTAWLTRCKTSMPGHAEVNQPGADEFGKMAKAKLGTN